MFLRRAIQSLANLPSAPSLPTARLASTEPFAATTEGGDWPLVDVRTGRTISARRETETGVPVSADTALNFHAWFRAMALIATKCAAVPRDLYKPVKDGREVDDGHGVHKLIGRKANEEQTAFQFWLQMAGHVASRGNAYAYIDRPITSGPIVGLIPCDPDKTHPVRKNGKLRYVVFPFGHEGEGYKLDAAEMLHFKGWGFDGLTGYAVWEIAASEIGLGRAERRLEASRYRNGGRPGIVLLSDTKLNQKVKDRIRDDWERMYTGLDNAGKTAVLDGGLKAETVTLDADELGQTEAAKMSLVAISNYTGVPVAKLGGQASGASQEQQDRAFLSDGLDFYLRVFDDETTDKLLTEAEKDGGYEVESDREALIKPDTQTLYSTLRIATGGRPIMTPNEGRKVIGMPPSDEKDADKLLTPLNMGQGGADNKPQPTDGGNDPGRPKEDGAPADDRDAEEETPKKAAALAPATLPPAIIPPAPFAARVPVDPLATVRAAARDALAYAVAKMVKRVGKAAVSAASKGSVKFCDFVAAIDEQNANVFRAEFRSPERVTAALAEDKRPKDGEAAEYLLSVLKCEYGELIDTATEKTIAAKASALYSEQLLRLPQQVCFVFQPDDTQEG